VTPRWEHLAGALPGMAFEGVSDRRSHHFLGFNTRRSTSRYDE
jgi:hypothetical protein